MDNEMHSSCWDDGFEKVIREVYGRLDLTPTPEQLNCPDFMAGLYSYEGEQRGRYGGAPPTSEEVEKNPVLVKAYWVGLAEGMGERGEKPNAMQLRDPHFLMMWRHGAGLSEEEARAFLAK